jgi:hypothetical protein
MLISSNISLHPKELAENESPELGIGLDLSVPEQTYSLRTTYRVWHEDCLSLNMILDDDRLPFLLIFLVNGNAKVLECFEGPYRIRIKALHDAADRIGDQLAARVPICSSE